MLNPLAQDLDHVLAHTAPVWDELRSAALFLTGGTGFFGCWILESFLWANEKLDLGASATVLTRDPDRFRARVPRLANHPAIRLHTGDVRSFAFPEGHFSHVMHAATDASALLNRDRPLDMLDTIVEGTRRVLDFSVACGARKFLLASSGAVYGKQPPDLPRVPETYTGAPDTMAPGSAYGEGKRIAELLCAIYRKSFGLETKIARGFAFVGPYMQLDAHFAIGNFIRDSLQGRPIRITGDGTPVRSYLYAADLMIWLWTILAQGEPGRPYNVGSARDFTIAEIASTVAGMRSACGVEIKLRPEPGAGRERYVPCTARAQREMGLRESVSLASAVRRTEKWFASHNPEGVPAQ
jgi:dTDP-glucose 4,6-dehydratase